MARRLWGLALPLAARHPGRVLLLLWMVGAIPTILILRRDVKRELGVRWVPAARGFKEYLRREAALMAVSFAVTLLWPVVLLKRRTVIPWLVGRPWLILPERHEPVHPW